MIRCVVALLFFHLRAHAQTVEPLNTVVHVAAWTTTGERIDKIWVTVSSLDGTEKYTGSGRDVDLALPTGNYVSSLRASGRLDSWPDRIKSDGNSPQL